MMLHFPLTDTSLSLSAPELMVLWISKLKEKGEPRIPAECWLVSCHSDTKSHRKGPRGEHASWVLRGSELKPSSVLPSHVGLVHPWSLQASVSVSVKYK